MYIFKRMLLFSKLRIKKFLYILLTFNFLLNVLTSKIHLMKVKLGSRFLMIDIKSFGTKRR